MSCKRCTISQVRLLKIACAFCTAAIEYVVKNGFVWHADSMTQMWPEYKPLPKPWWHSDDDWEELKPELPEPWEGVPIAEGVELKQSTKTNRQTSSGG